MTAFETFRQGKQAAKAIDEKFQELEANLEKEALVLENFEQEIGKEWRFPDCFG